MIEKTKQNKKTSLSLNTLVSTRYNLGTSSTQVTCCFEQYCTAFLKMDASTGTVCFKVAIKKEQDQWCRSTQELVEECSTWMQDVASNIYAYQAIHFVQPAVYIISQGRSAITHIMQQV